MRLGLVKGGLGCAKAIEPEEVFFVKFVISFVSTMFFLQKDRGRLAQNRGHGWKSTDRYGDQ